MDLEQALAVLSAVAALAAAILSVASHRDLKKKALQPGTLADLEFPWKAFDPGPRGAWTLRLTLLTAVIALIVAVVAA